MSTKLSGKALVIQLTRDHIRVAKMQLGLKVQILCDAIVDTPAGAVEDGYIRDLGAVTAALSEVLAAPDFSGTKKVVFVLCTTQALSEKVTVPAAKGQRLDKIMDANMDMYFPLAVYDYHVTRQELGHLTDEHGVDNIIVQLWAIPKTLLTRYYELAAACGLNVLAIDYCGNSHARVSGATFLEPKSEKLRNLKKKTAAAEFESAKEPLENPVSVYMMAEPELMVMTFVEQGQVRMQRSFLCGYDINSALSEAMIVIDYYRSINDDRDAPIELIICGSLAENEHFTEQASMLLNIPARIQDSDHSPGWCCCIGAAQTALDFGSPDLICSEKKSFGPAWHYGVVLAGAAAAVLSIIMLMTSKTAWDNELLALQDSEMMLRIQAAQNQKAADTYSDYTSQYYSFIDDRNSLFASLHTYNDNMVLILQELEELLPEQAFVEDIAIRADSMALQFSCTDKEEAAYLIMALREMKYATPDSVSDLSATADRADSATAKDSTFERDDGRIHFSAVLFYNANLMEAPPTREGLIGAEIPPMLEVDQ